MRASLREWLGLAALIIVLVPRTASAINSFAWNPQVSVTTKTDMESKAFTISWTNAGAGQPPSACDNDGSHPDPAWNGTHHLELHFTGGDVSGSCSGISGPSTPSSTTLAKVLQISASTTDYIVHRADKEYGFTLFACEDPTCTSWYADEAPTYDYESISSGSDTDSACTEAEKYELTHITGSSDYDINVVNSPSRNAPHAFFYPDDYPTSSSTIQNTLALYFDYSSLGSASLVYYKRYGSTHWPADGFNCDNDSGCSTTTAPRCCTTDWANSNAETLVAESSTTASDDDYLAYHPWAMVTEDSSASNEKVVLFVQSVHSTSDKLIIQIGSYDAAGTDFGRDCGSSSCSYTYMDSGDHSIQGKVAVSVDGSSEPYLRQATHSRIYHPYVEDPIVTEGTDEPVMLLQFDLPTSDQGHGCYDTDEDDVGWADGAYSSGSWSWTLATETTSGTSGSAECVETHIENAHDATCIPLPGDEIKIYYKDADNSQKVTVAYWDGSDWVDSSEVEFYWDGGSTAWTSHLCIDNVSAVVHADGSSVNEGMFFKLLGKGDGDCPSGASYAFDATKARIVFAEHTN